MLFAWAALLALVITYSFLGWKLQARLERLHPSKWNELGKPKLIDTRLSSALGMLKFTFVGTEYKSLGDIHVERYVVLLRSIFAAIVVYTVAFNMIAPVPQR